MNVRFTCYKRALKHLFYSSIFCLLQIISSDVIYIFVCSYHASALVIFFNGKNVTVSMLHTPVGILSSLSLDAIFLLCHLHNVVTVFIFFDVVFLTTLITH